MSDHVTNGGLSRAEWAEIQPSSGEGPAPRLAVGAELTPALRTWLEESPESLLAGRTVASMEGWDGSENLLWRVCLAGLEGCAVVKLFADAGLARGRRTLDGHERFAPAGLAPRTWWFDRAPAGLPEPLIVYGWEQGEAAATLAEIPLEPLAQALAAIHGSSVTETPRYSTQPPSLHSWLELQRASAAGLERRLGAHRGAPTAAFAHLSRRTLEWAANALPLWQGAALTPIHGDLRPENILVRTEGTPLLLDWENYGLGDPAREVARLALREDAAATRLRELYLETNPPQGTAERIEAWRRLIPFELLTNLLAAVTLEKPDLTSDARAETAALISELHHFAASSLDAAGDPARRVDYSTLLAGAL